MAVLAKHSCACKIPNKYPASKAEQEVQFEILARSRALWSCQSAEGVDCSSVPRTCACIRQQQYAELGGHTPLHAVWSAPPLHGVLACLYLSRSISVGALLAHVLLACTVADRRQRSGTFGSTAAICRPLHTQTVDTLPQAPASPSQSACLAAGTCARGTRAAAASQCAAPGAPAGARARRSKAAKPVLGGLRGSAHLQALWQMTLHVACLAQHGCA